MKTLSALLTLFGSVLTESPRAGGLVVTEATLEGIAFLIIVGGLLGVIKMLLERKRVR